ncbi:MAG: hypothetical protein H6707_07730 [Deltaproteobacteria bacterium]|nr:hypothetical protein [Deltaproteobacteria bacterium]
MTGFARINCWLAITVICLAGTACRYSIRQGPKPAETLSRFAGALKKGDLRTAYGLLSKGFRERHDYAAFSALIKSNPDEVAWLADELANPPRETRLTAALNYGTHDTLRLQLEEGEWRIADSPLELYGQATPAQALRSFLRAATNQRYEVMLRFVPSKWAEAMSVAKLKRQFEGEKKAEMAALLKRLRDSLGAPIQKTGLRAVMPYGENQSVRFIKEQNVWKIEDLD